jgi:hypothetical protein
MTVLDQGREKQHNRGGVIEHGYNSTEYKFPTVEGNLLWNQDRMYKTLTDTTICCYITMDSIASRNIMSCNAREIVHFVPMTGSLGNTNLLAANDNSHDQQ